MERNFRNYTTNVDSQHDLNLIKSKLLALGEKVDYGAFILSSNNETNFIKFSTSEKDWYLGSNPKLPCLPVWEYMRLLEAKPESFKWF